ncbi:TetR/AcrR family transcriptional regulator C-terminal domain-containing protein [Streptomyces sp. NPDC050504]|uniref:TetR/AcrR family transcriptional regulator C-terminal domain-containing protein n=1 Tax=Streptomyces sp. NPDC050504 TaxID=3365618 RepID=UPI0037AFEE85
MTTVPPYLRIASAIRRDIESGRLAPGAPVPSTRALTREWGVAMATATKALAALRQEGLVRPVPGVGTVVAGKREHGGPGGPGGARQAPLTWQRVVRAALALADAEGLESVSMRRVATELDTSSMALYRHVAGKGELVRLMTDAAFAELDLGPSVRQWRRGLDLAARELWAMYGRHPWMATAMAGFSRPQPTPHTMRYTEWVLGALRDSGLRPHDMLHTHLSVLAFVQGVALAAESEGRARQDTGMSGEEWLAHSGARFDAIISAGTFPLLVSVFRAEDFDLDLTTLFEFGLRRTLDGIAVLVADSAGDAARELPQVGTVHGESDSR